MTSAAGHPAFHVHEPRLWRALGLLAKSGYTAPPDEAQDLLHDFYLEAWDGLVQRHDASRSKFTTYMSAAFFKFAKRRILRDQTLRARLVDLEHAQEVAAEEPTPLDVLESSQGVSQIRHVVDALPGKTRLVLTAFLSGGDASERTLAKRFSLTRHAVREHLADAVGQVAARMGQLPKSDPASARVMHELWIEGRSVKGTAVALELPIVEVQRAKARGVAELLASIRSYERLRVEAGSDDMPYTDYFVEALRHPDDEARVRRVAEHAAKIRDELRDEGLTLSDSDHLRLAELDSAKVARVYAALSGALDAQAEDGELEALLKQQRLDESVEIGMAFLELLSGLGPRFHDWPLHFGMLEKIDVQLQEQVLHEGCGENGGAYALDLVVYGMTPLSVQSATRNVELLLNRTHRNITRPQEGRPQEQWLGAVTKADGDIGLKLGGHRFSIPEAVVDAQIAGARHMPVEAVKPFRKWLFDVMGERPFMVGGHRYDVTDRTFERLERHNGNEELMRRWTRLDRSVVWSSRSGSNAHWQAQDHSGSVG